MSDRLSKATESVSVKRLAIEPGDADIAEAAFRADTA